MKSSNNTRLHWNAKAHRLLNGAKIIKVEYLTEKETKESGWYNSPVALLLEKGKNKFWVYPMSDDEGNDGGALGTTDERISTLPLL